MCLCIATGSGLSRVSRDDPIAGIGSVKIEDGLLQRLDDRKIDAGTRDPAPWPTTCSFLETRLETMDRLHLANHGATPLQLKKKNTSDYALLNRSENTKYDSYTAFAEIRALAVLRTGFPYSTNTPRTFPARTLRQIQHLRACNTECLPRKNVAFRYTALNPQEALTRTRYLLSG